MIHRQIDIFVEDSNTSDYHDLAKNALSVLTNYLYGGYYEPLSERDKLLGDKISKLLDEISETN